VPSLGRRIGYAAGVVAERLRISKRTLGRQLGSELVGEPAMDQRLPMVSARLLAALSLLPSDGE
jgi:hypothetical protein